MKRFTAALAAIGVLAVTTVALALYGTGYAKTVTATTTTGRLSGFTANAVSVVNNGTNDVFAVPSCSTNTFNTRLAAGTAFRILGGTAFTFDCNQQESIASICYATTNDATEVIIGAF